MRLVLFIASWLGVMVLPIVIVCAILTGLFFDPGFYHAGEAKYQVQQVVGLTPAQLDRVNRGIIRFFAGTETLPQALAASGASPDVFKEKEILHMNDVRGLVRLIGQAEIVGLAFLVGLVGLAAVSWRPAGLAAVTRVLIYGPILTIGLVLLTGLVTYTAFDWFFLTFHELVFSNNFWQLDPRTDHLIQMFPFGFWYDAMLTVVLRVLIVTLALAACGVVLGRFERRRV